MKQRRMFDWTKIAYVAKGILVGVIVGIVVSLFRYTVEFMLDHIIEFYDYLRVHPRWIIGWIFASLTAAFIIAILVRDEPNIKGSGIQDIEGQLQGVLKLNWFSILWRKFIGGSLAIGSGLALGREGPSIQLGGAVGQGVHALLKGNRSQKNILISAGASAGLSAAFNAPISGITFILEEVHHKFSGILLLSAFSSSIAANFVAYRIFGIEPALHLGELILFPLEHYLHLIVLGVFLAIVGRFYQEVLLFMPSLYKRLPIPAYLYGFLPFLIVIPIGLYFPQMLGGGTSIIAMINSARFPTLFFISIFVFRFIFSHISYGSGLPGGIFIPVLCLGAILGGIYGNTALFITGIEDAFIRSFIVYAMGGFLTAVTKAPLTSVMLITEMTGTEAQLMPLAVVCLSAYIFADFIGSESIYEKLLERKVHRIPTVFNGELASVECSVEPDSPLDGITLRNISLPFGSQLVKVKRHNNEFIPRQDTTIWAGDELLVHCDSGFISEVKKYLDEHS
ncbi:ClC family H(+)/Cl(-) exchange transporter [Marinilactibacillus sp. GCM10026970]|uniref:ClC family H(+)/Cl(-) exchange transporter n=1 Tax=Marinilactibacillus sp. GCM10026970 TaxID=3252642 RepID=UPI00361FDD55